MEHFPYSVYQSSFHLEMPQKSFLPHHIWETLSESTKQMIIEHNKKVKLNNPTPYPSGSKTKPNPTLGKSHPAPEQIHQHSQDEPTEESPPDTSTQTLVNIPLHHILVGARLNLTLHWVSLTLLQNKFTNIYRMHLQRNPLLTLLPRPL